MKKIGLITPYRIDNYGTKLQAYAMQELLKKLGYNVEILDYYPAYDMRPKIILKKVIAKIPQNNFLSKKKVCSDKIIDKVQIRHSAILKFDVNYKRSEKIKGYCKLKKTINVYDAFVCGSDQIWAEGNLITDYFNLNFVYKKKKTIAYAPSFGTTQIPKNMLKQYKHFISNIDFLSARELSGVKIIKEITGRDAVQVLDPTLLVENAVWDLLLAKFNPRKVAEKYIFCYFLGDCPEHRRAAEKVSLQTGYKIISLAHMKNYVVSDEEMQAEKFFDISPEEFITLIKNAEYICTDSFHGVAFSIIYHRPFFAFERFVNKDLGSTNTRIYSLLSMMRIENRLIKDMEIPIENLYERIDYETVDKVLLAERKRSGGYLKNALLTACN